MHPSRNITSVADDKTRVLTEAEAAGLVVEKPRFVDGKIVFFCPNGHRLVVAEVHAGKRGRCDKAGCGVAVVIPVRPSRNNPTLDGLGETAEPSGEAAAVAPSAESVQDPALEDERNVKAPERLPDGLESTQADGTTDGDGGEPEATAAWQFVDGDDDAAVEPSAAAAATWGGFDGAEPEGDPVDNPTARLVARLWVERDHGGVVELHLTGGSVILPEWYESRWSRGTHGLFASQAPDGSITLTAVAWDAIQKVVVRQVTGLPDGMFE